MGRTRCNRVAFRRRDWRMTPRTRFKKVRTPHKRIVVQYLNKMHIKNRSRPSCKVTGQKLLGFHPLRGNFRNYKKIKRPKYHRAHYGCISANEVRKRVLRAFLYGEYELFMRSGSCATDKVMRLKMKVSPEARFEVMLEQENARYNERHKVEKKEEKEEEDEGDLAEEMLMEDVKEEKETQEKKKKKKDSSKKKKKSKKKAKSKFEDNEEEEEADEKKKKKKKKKKKSDEADDDEKKKKSKKDKKKKRKKKDEDEDVEMTKKKSKKDRSKKDKKKKKKKSEED